jgi:hypothetical protein
MALTPKDVDELHETMQKLLERWMKIRLVFQKTFSDAPIQNEHETAYLQIKSDVSRLYRSLTTKLPGGLKFDGDKMLEMLKNAMTMEHLSRQPQSERQVLFTRWHGIYIRMTRTLGALEVMKAGYYPHMHRKLLKS